MEEFIKKIIEIDKQARESVQDYDTLRKNADEEIAKINEKAKEDAWAENEKKIEKYRLVTEQETAKRLDNKRRFYENTAEKFGKIYDEKKDEWANTLARRAIEQ